MKRPSEEYLPLAFSTARYFARTNRKIPYAELIGEACLALVYAEKQFKPEKKVPFGAFATMVVRHRLGMFVKYWRSRDNVQYFAVGENRKDSAPNYIDSMAAPHTNQSARLDLQKMLDRARLPIRWQMALWLHSGYGWTLDEVGRLLGVSRQRVYEIMAKSLERIRSRIPSKEYEIENEGSPATRPHREKGLTNGQA